MIGEKAVRALTPRGEVCGGGGENLSPLCFKTVFIVLLNELKSIISSICDVEWKEKPHWIWFLFLVKLLVGFLESSEDAFSSYIVR